LGEKGQQRARYGRAGQSQHRKKAVPEPRLMPITKELLFAVPGGVARGDRLEIIQRPYQS
jgi:hypothetical protein